MTVKSRDPRDAADRRFYVIDKGMAWLLVFLTFIAGLWVGFALGVVATLG